MNIACYGVSENNTAAASEISPPAAVVVLGTMGDNHNQKAI